jgi:molybdopterin molybdotransferase
MLSIDEARSAVLAAVRPLPPERVELLDAHGLVLAEDVTAAGDSPPFDNSAMDGYAVGDAGGSYVVVGESRAGAPCSRAIGEGEAVAISTGAAVPEGTVAVVPVERLTKRVTTTRFVGQIAADGEIRAGDHVRRAGEDLRAGEVVLRAGTRMTPAALGVAAGAGRAEVSVARRPRVAIVATGDELVDPGEPLRPGQIHDSNRLALAALAREAGATVVSSERVGDDHEATAATLRGALDAADLLIVSGGVSVGPHDHVKPALEELGVQEVFWRVALRPGKPTWFGTKDDTLVIGLPGNPVSALVTFVLFARPALAALRGEPLPERTRVTLGEPIPRQAQRDEAVRVELRDGLAYATGPQGSHILSSMVSAHGLAIVPRGEGTLEAGSEVEMEVL